MKSLPTYVSKDCWKINQPGYADDVATLIVPTKSSTNIRTLIFVTIILFIRCLHIFLFQLI